VIVNRTWQNGRFKDGNAYFYAKTKKQAKYAISGHKKTRGIKLYTRTSGKCSQAAKSPQKRNRRQAPQKPLRQNVDNQRRITLQKEQKARDNPNQKKRQKIKK